MEGYPSKSTEPGSLHVDQFLRPPKSQSRWYSIHPAEPKDPTRQGKFVNTWHNDAAKLNSAFPRICKPAVANTHPPSRPLSQVTLRKWEKAAKETSYVCNQSTGFNRCITKLQDNVQENLKALQTELSKGKSSTKAQAALDELHYLASFNQNLSFAMGKSLQHMSDFIFVQMANLTLARSDSYLANLKPGVKPDTFSALRNCPLNGYALFPDATIRKAEEEIIQFENAKHTPQPGPGHGGFAGKKQQGRDLTKVNGSKPKMLPVPVVNPERICRPGSPLATEVVQEDMAEVVKLDAVPDRPRTRPSINDNYCVTSPEFLTRPIKTVMCVQSKVNVSSHVVGLVPSAINGKSLLRGDICPSSENSRIKSVKSVFFCRSLCLCPLCN